MPPLTPEQLRKRERAEALIGLMAPLLNVILAVGDRVSRLVEREDQEYYPPRPRTDAEPPRTGAEPSRSAREDAGARAE